MNSRSLVTPEDQSPLPPRDRQPRSEANSHSDDRSLLRSLSTEIRSQSEAGPVPTQTAWEGFAERLGVSPASR